MSEVGSKKGRERGSRGIARQGTSEVFVYMSRFFPSVSTWKSRFWLLQSHLLDTNSKTNPKCQCYIEIWLGSYQLIWQVYPEILCHFDNSEFYTRSQCILLISFRKWFHFPYCILYTLIKVVESSMNFFVVEFTHLVVITKHKVMSHCVLLLSSNASVIKHYFFVFSLLLFVYLRNVRINLPLLENLWMPLLRNKKQGLTNFLVENEIFIELLSEVYSAAIRFKGIIKYSNLTSIYF